MTQLERVIQFAVESWAHMSQEGLQAYREEMGDDLDVDQYLWELSKQFFAIGHVTIGEASSTAYFLGYIALSIQSEDLDRRRVCRSCVYNPWAEVRHD